MEPEEVKQLLAVVQKVRDRAMILVLLRTGMRIGELLATRMSELNLRLFNLAAGEVFSVICHFAQFWGVPLAHR